MKVWTRKYPSIFPMLRNCVAR